MEHEDRYFKDAHEYFNAVRAVFERLQRGSTQHLARAPSDARHAQASISSEQLYAVIDSVKCSFGDEMEPDAQEVDGMPDAIREGVQATVLAPRDSERDSSTQRPTTSTASASGDDAGSATPDEAVLHEPPAYATIEFITDGNLSPATLYLPYELAPTDYVHRLLQAVQQGLQPVVSAARHVAGSTENRLDAYYLLKDIAEDPRTVAECLMPHGALRGGQQDERLRLVGTAAGLLREGAIRMRRVRNSIAHRVSASRGTQSWSYGRVNQAFLDARGIFAVLGAHNPVARVQSRTIRRLHEQFLTHMASKRARSQALYTRLGLAARVDRAVILAAALSDREMPTDPDRGDDDDDGEDASDEATPALGGTRQEIGSGNLLQAEVAHVADPSAVQQPTLVPSARESSSAQRDSRSLASQFLNMAIQAGRVAAADSYDGEFSMATLGQAFSAQHGQKMREVFNAAASGMPQLFDSGSETRSALQALIQACRVPRFPMNHTGGTRNEDATFEMVPTSGAGPATAQLDPPSAQDAASPPSTALEFQRQVVHCTVELVRVHPGRWVKHAQIGAFFKRIIGGSIRVSFERFRGDLSRLMGGVPLSWMGVLTHACRKQAAGSDALQWNGRSAVFEAEFTLRPTGGAIVHDPMSARRAPRDVFTDDLDEDPEAAANDGNDDDDDDGEEHPTEVRINDAFRLDLIALLQVTMPAAAREARNKDAMTLSALACQLGVISGPEIRQLQVLDPASREQQKERDVVVATAARRMVAAARLPTGVQAPELPKRVREAIRSADGAGAASGAGAGAGVSVAD